MTEPMHAVLARAQQFRADDPDPETQTELDALLARAATDEHAQAELRDRFVARLSFGTAGLRGLLGAGDNRMNVRVVAQTTSALCAELATQVANAKQRGLCVAFDGRHKSRTFADEVQTIANGAGFVVHAFEEPMPTPLLAFAV
jgi:phosphomannomutase